MYNPVKCQEEIVMRTLRSCLLVWILMQAVFGCTPYETKPSPDESKLGTAVAATLTSAAPKPAVGKTEKAPKPTLPATAEKLAVVPTATVSHTLRIVYTNAGDAWYIEVPTPPIQLTTLSNVEDVWISSDGAKVAFTRRISPDAQAEIGAVNTDGSGQTILLTTSQLDAFYTLDPMLRTDVSQVVFVPGTHNIVFNTRVIAQGPGLLKHDDLYLLNTDNGSLSTLFTPGAGGDITFSRNGDKMAIVRPDSISLASSDGTNLIPNLVSYTPVITYSEFMYYAQPVWRPDSSALGVAIPSPDFLTPPTDGTIWRIPANGDPAVTLGTILGDFYFSQAFTEAVLSPNLQHVAFLRDTPTPNVRDLYIANPDGTSASVYATGDIRFLGWSPDSAHFIYSDGGPMNLLLGVLGSAPSLIGACNQPRWVDSSHFLCLSGSLGSWTLIRGQIGAGLTPIVNPAGDFVSYDFAK
jgi:hypothetical protein